MGIEGQSGGVSVSTPADTGITGAIRYATGSGRRAVATGLAAVGVYCLLVLSAFPEYAVRAVADGRVVRAVWLLTWHTRVVSGWVGIGLTVVSSGAAGVAAVVGHGVVNGSRSARAGGATGLSSALLAGTCASCGAGLAGVAGLGGVAALFPFSGNLARLVGAALLAVFLWRTGHPLRCEPS
jgi:hypothetical protein